MSGTRGEYKRWQESEKREIVRCRQAGEKPRDLARRFGVTPAQMWCLLSRLGVKALIANTAVQCVVQSDTTPLSADERLLMEVMRRQGKSDQNIADCLGRSFEMVTKALRSLDSHKKSSPGATAKNGRLPGTFVSPVHYMNVQEGQCRHVVNRGLYCGKPTDKNERCPLHRGDA